MAQSKFKHVKVSAIATVVPQREISIYDELQYYGGNVKKVDRMRKMVGFFKRRVVDEGVTSSDLALAAAKKLLSDSGVDKNSIDALILVLQTPDYPAPASAFSIHRDLNLPQTCIAFDVNLGCPGWVYGLQIAHSMIESGANKKILLLTADTPSTKIDVSDRQNAPLFGDAGTATLLEYSEKELPETFFDLGADGKGYEAIIIPAGGARLPLKFSREADDKYIAKILEPIDTANGRRVNLTDKYMNGLEVFNFTTNVVPEKIKDLVKYANVSVEDIDALVLHQGNKQIVTSVCELSGFPLEKCSYKTFEDFGNQTVSSVPAAICHTLGDKISSPEGVRALCSGFGIGLAWGSCLISLSGVKCSGVSDFELTDTIQSRSQLIDYWQKKFKDT